MKFVPVVLLLLALAGCTKPKEHDELREMLGQAIGAEVGDGFKVIEFDSSSAMGDYVETYRIEFNETQFSSIISSINKSESWELLPNGKVFQKVSEFNGHGFNGVIVAVSPENHEVRVQFGWE